MSDLRDSLAQVVELVSDMTPGVLTVYDANDGDGWPTRPLWCFMNPDYDSEDEDALALQGSIHYGGKEDADGIAAAVNFLRTHGPALLAMMEGHSPDAGKMVDDRSAELTTAWMAGAESVRDRAAEDSARLDYIERTFSGMTNRERYLPVTMIWGKGANGRTLREACDKYMAKETPFTGVTFVEREMPPGVVAEVRTRHDRVTIVDDDDAARAGERG
jgi:hypothetical protein